MLDGKEQRGTCRIVIMLDKTTMSKINGTILSRMIVGRNIRDKMDGISGKWERQMTTMNESLHDSPIYLILFSVLPWFTMLQHVLRQNEDRIVTEME